MTEQELYLLIDEYGFDLKVWPPHLASEARQNKEFNQILESCNKINTHLLENNRDQHTLDVTKLKNRIMALTVEEEKQQSFFTMLAKSWQQLMIGGALAAACWVAVIVLLFPANQITNNHPTDATTSQINISIKKSEDATWLKVFTPKSTLERMML